MPGALGPASAGSILRLLRITTSTRRLRVRPWGVSLESIGTVSARPTTEKRARLSWKVPQKVSSTAMALAQESSQLLLKRALWMGMESVCPSSWMELGSVAMSSASVFMVGRLDWSSASVPEEKKADCRKLMTRPRGSKRISS